MNWLVWKNPDAGKDWGQEEKGMTEDQIVGWHHWLNEHGFGWTPGVGDGQGGLVCCGSWVTKSQTWLSDWTELNWIVIEILQRTFTGFSGFYPLTYIVFSSLDSLDKDYWDHCPSSSLFFFFFFLLRNKSFKLKPFTFSRNKHPGHHTHPHQMPLLSLEAHQYSFILY